MQVPSIFRSSIPFVPALHRWPQPLKRALLAFATFFCAVIYMALIIGIFSILAILLDVVNMGM